MMRTFPLFLILLAALGSFGCGEVEHCTKVDEPGCLKSVPLPDGTCLFDLVPRQGICVKPGGDADKCSLCAEGDLCVPERNQCVNFCAEPSMRPGSVAPPDPIFCVATRTNPNENPMLSFEEVCKRRCQLQCRRWEQFCGHKCEQGYCDRPEVQTQCATDCMPVDGVRDLACLTRSCNNTRLGLCEPQMNCPNGVMPDCANLTCTNECQYNNEGHFGDGYCDDGDPLSAASASCPWGSDCADCGVRKGMRREPAYLGDLCAFNSNCEGGTDDPTSARTWCIAVGEMGMTMAPAPGVPRLTRCAADCSRDPNCPEGFECRELVFRNSDGTTYRKVEGGVTAQACFPMMCL